MKVPRIMNRGRIAPSAPRVSSDSERNSWSSASIVSTIETQSPQPQLPEEVTQTLQKPIVVSSINKKVIIGLCIAAVCLIIISIVLGAVLPLTLNKNSPTTNSTTQTMNITHNK
ncbi:unnamed protein product [Rotaria sordida]|uniref:Uncharacterized protein n=1 Tax=Rotaria sordida TaxID=392033 RepID=A0A818L2J3_9BILA|nr:unnamed protein product [Rotaria sordida]CAF1150559.1 unnamed protein product [Rotaria sordida]CAF1388592.1 unnamed protein product [Rotaria sordida]CAF3546807.1 unnamed protein product [Rotaria sordida]CAF3567298.1 unnamed protein product [Rotaria sordida]